MLSFYCIEYLLTTKLAGKCSIHLGKCVGGCIDIREDIDEQVDEACEDTSMNAYNEQCFRFCSPGTGSLEKQCQKCLRKYTTAFCPALHLGNTCNDECKSKKTVKGHCSDCCSSICTAALKCTGYILQKDWPNAIQCMIDNVGDKCQDCICGYVCKYFPKGCKFCKDTG